MKPPAKKEVSSKKPRTEVRRELDPEPRLASLPKTIALSGAHLTINFESGLEFLESMAKLTRAIDNDFDEFLPPLALGSDPAALAEREQLREKIRKLANLCRERRQKEANRDKTAN